MIEERYRLVMDRIKEIGQEDTFGEPLVSFFHRCSSFMMMLSSVLERSLSGGAGDVLTEDLAVENHKLYEDILGDNYGKSFADPDYAANVFTEAGVPEGKKIAAYMSFIYTELRGLIPYAYEGRTEIFTIHAELFVEIHTMFRLAALDEGFPKADQIRDVIYWFERDNCDVIIPDSISDKIDPANDFLRRIVTEEDLTSERFLYLSGEYVTENEIETARFINTLPEEKIQLMADTFTQAYRTGFIKTNKPIDRKTSANIRYNLGFERVIRAAVSNFEKMGLASVIYRAGSLSLTRSATDRIGFYGAIPNRQFDYDHKDDAAIYLDADLVTRRLEVLTESYENRKELARGHAGPAVMEVFGEEPFTPVVKENAVHHTDRTRKLSVEYSARASSIVNRYIIGEERSFTIIAFPIPAIGNDFERIFEDTVAVNTLDAAKYEMIQQEIIDALDKGDFVEIKGSGDNVTDLRVGLWPVTDPDTQTKFENCVADVNIPVGEVFTSPKLAGTDGVLNVTKVFLRGLLFKDLRITFKDGMITDYTCSNYDNEEDNRRFIKDNLLFNHDTIPIGEFAIGTNTTAYRMGRKYDIEGRLPILIGEKTGPHFAIGDTCYSHEEDVKVYNPDGKEIIAKENEVSKKRTESEKDAYFQCHTDITIPYDELEYIRSVGEKGTTYIIKNGKFVLPGTEELNIPLDERS
ncbi:MAG: aminopeptidase [Lachnospiraceae bacterium]|nr:aminopeptidase [Lachnospiraceae bacterium]